jgi:hypothetical protein
MSTYLAISPQRPALLDSFLGAQTDESSVVPQLSYVPWYSESVTSTALVYNPLGPAVEDYNVSYVRSLQFNVLSDSPARFRATGSNTLDVELSLDSFSYTQLSPLVLEVPPTDPFSIPWSREDYYTRSTTLYVFQSVVVPPFSTKIFGGTWPLVVLQDGGLIESIDSVPVIRGLAQNAIEDPELQPKHVVGLNGLGNTPDRPSKDTNITAYNAAVRSFLEQVYNSLDVPPPPSTITGVLDTLVVLSSELFVDEGPTKNSYINGLIKTFNQLGLEFSPITTSLGQVNYTFNGTTRLQDYLGASQLAEPFLRTQALLSNLLKDDNVISPFDEAPGSFGPIAEQLLTSESFSAVLPNGLLGSLAALVGGLENAYFLNWVFFIRPAPEPVLGAELSGLINNDNN